MVDSRYGRGGTTPARLQRRWSAALHRGAAAGKLLLLDTAGGPTLGLRFGMTGGWWSTATKPSTASATAPASSTKVGAGPRRLQRRRKLLLHDPRRFGSLEIAPDEDRLGPDALDGVRRELARRPGGGPARGGHGAPLRPD